jgi:hypothetical protein
MKLESSKSVWTGRGITWMVLLAVSCGMMLMGAFVLGPILFSNDAVSRQVAVRLFCPGAVSSTQQNGPSTQTTSDPTGPYGHTVEITCSMPDGSTQVVPNERYALASIAAMFGGGALCGLALSLPLFLVPFFLFRKKKED